MRVGYLNSIIQRIPIRKPCKGYYLRWYYNGWHYWFFLPGETNMETVGEAYRTIGTRKISIGSGHLTYSQAQAIRTILLTREIYLLTADGWKNIRVEPSSVITLENMVNGYEMEFVMIIGSKEISTITGYTPIPIIPVVDPIPDPGACERIIGTQVWACKNYDSDYPGSKVFNDDEANRAIYGGLYTFNQIMAAGFVPLGWHVPTLDEWQELIDFVGALIAGKELKEVGTDHWDAPNTGADTYGFAALGAGFRYYSSYYSLKQLARIWTANEYSSDRGYYVEMNYNNDDAIIKSLIKESYLSVRLVKDTPAPPPPPPLIDRDGNIYTTVIIGSYEIIVESLRTKKYADGSDIRYVIDTDPDMALEDGSPGHDGLFNWFLNDEVNKNPWGAYYNWFAVTNVKGLVYFERGGVEEADWRVFTKADFLALQALIGGINEAGKLKEVGYDHWNSPNLNATDEFGFRAVGAGINDAYGGGICSNRIQVIFWASSEQTSSEGNIAKLDYNSPDFPVMSIDKRYGLSVRCIRDI